MLVDAIPFALAFVDQRLTFAETDAARRKVKKHGTSVQQALCIFDWDTTFTSPTSEPIRCVDIMALPEFQERLVNILSGRGKKYIAHILPLERHGDDALLLVEYKPYNQEILVDLECLPVGQADWHRRHRSGVCLWCGGRKSRSRPKKN